MTYTVRPTRAFSHLKSVSDGPEPVSAPFVQRRRRDFLPVLQPAPKCVRPEWPCFLRSADKTECCAHPDTRRDSGCDNQEAP